MSDVYAWQKRGGWILGPLGAAYARVMRARRWIFGAGFRERFDPPVPCVSVGNIGWGGSGKTPLVSWLLGWAAHRGLTPAVLTRGYGATPPSAPYLVRADSPPEHAGDEPLLLARHHPGAHIVVDPVRRRSGPWIVERANPDFLLLDDGMQHLAAGRHLDLVLLRPEDVGDQWNRVIPGGSWREGKSALAVAGAFLVKAEPAAFEALVPDLERRLERYRRPVFSFFLEPRGLVPVLGQGANPGAGDGEDLLRPFPAPDLGNAPYFLVTGVGSPGQVAATAERFLGRAPVAHLMFSDHHAFDEADWKRIRSEATEAGAQHVLCTPKDAVKLAEVASAVGIGDGPALWTFELDVAFGPALFTREVFPSWWERRISSLLLAMPRTE